ncbi:MAG: SU10 major capsid protein, partial [Candidatus Saccharimonadales bacterium]
HNISNTELFAAGVVSSSSGAPGTNVSVVLTAATAAACVGNSVCYLKSGARAYVQSNTSGTLDIFSIDGTNIAAADVAAGVAITFPSVAFGEGSVGADPERWPKNTFTNVVQIFKNKYELTDVQMASQIEVDVDGDFTYQGIQRIESYLKFRKLIALGLIIGTYSGDNFSASSPALTDSSSKPVNVTRGVDQYVKSYGTTYPLINSTSFDLPDMQTIDTTLDTIRASNQYMFWCSNSMNQKLDIFLNAMNNSSMLSQAGRFLIGEGEDLKLGIKNFNFFNRTYHKMKLPLLTDRNTLGYTGLGNISTSAYMLPVGSANTVNRGRLPFISTRYMYIPGTKSLRYLEQPTGGLIQPYTSDQAVSAVNFYSIQGLEIVNPNFLFKVTA